MTIRKMAVQDGKVREDFKLESLEMVGDHSQKVEAPAISSEDGSKDCANLPSSTAVSRIIPILGMSTTILDQMGIMGSLLHYGLVISFMGSAFLVLLYLWSQGKLHWDEEPKFQMLPPQEEEKSHE